MSVFKIHGLRATVALVFLSSLLQPAFAGSGGSCGSADRLIVALRLAQVLYPELKGKESSITFSTGNGTFVSGPTDMDALRVRFDKPAWAPDGDGNQQLDARQSHVTPSDGVELPFHLYFNFVDIYGSAKQRQLACHPLNFTSEAGYKGLERVMSAIHPHPEWSDEEELIAARKLGLRYGPEDKDAILRKLPIKELAKFYGSLKVKDAKFSMNVGQKCIGCSFVDSRWEITLSRSGATRGLRIVVEPFFGQITSISE